MDNRMSFDPYRPNREPWRSIYDAFQLEAAKRSGRSVGEWIAAEEQAVLVAATRAAAQAGWVLPTLDMVRRAENYARGSADYGLKWVAQLVRFIQMASQEKPAGAGTALVDGRQEQISRQS